MVHDARIAALCIGDHGVEELLGPPIATSAAFRPRAVVRNPLVGPSVARNSSG